jgi:N-acetylglucosaminyl-diphospho-decaprenol L-rhamnosyltransferase
LGGFDEQFFYYYEDMDLCRRVRQAGPEVIYWPGVTITHLGGHSTKKRFPAVAFALDREVTR